MKQLYFKILAFNFMLFSPLLAFSETNLEFRSAAFFHSSDRFREIYGKVGPSYQLEATTSLYNCFDCFANIDWYYQNGKSDGLNWKTNVTIANLSIGIKYPFYINESFSAYVGIGPSISRIVLKNHNHNTHQKKSSDRVVVGGVLKSGLIYSINCNFFLDVFVDYLYQPVHYSTRVDIGGVKVGAGLGYRF